MDTCAKKIWLCETQIVSNIPNNRQHVLFSDNCSGRNSIAELSDTAICTNTVVRLFPRNATHSIQPRDSFGIQKIKNTLSRWLEACKMSMVRAGMWSASLGKVYNPRWKFFVCWERRLTTYQVCSFMVIYARAPKITARFPQESMKYRKTTNYKSSYTPRIIWAN